MRSLSWTNTQCLSEHTMMGDEKPTGIPSHSTSEEPSTMEDRAAGSSRQGNRDRSLTNMSMSTGVAEQELILRVS
jgi:hypothetical protein